MAGEVTKKVSTLEEKLEAKKAQKTDWDTPKDDWEYISVPAENALGEKHASLGLNGVTFEAGKTYLVPPIWASTLRERLKIYAKSVVRVLQPRRDYAAENSVSRSNPTYATPVDPSTIPNQ